jgi:tetratricopeptide (TPR) repeat protein
MYLFSSPSHYLPPIMAKSIEQIEEELAAATDDARRVSLLNDLAYRIYFTDPLRGMQLGEEAYSLAVALDDLRAQARSLRTIARGHDARSDYRAAMELSRRALDIYRKIGDIDGAANALIRIGISARGMTDYGTSLSVSKEALENFRECGNNAGMAIAWNNIGVVHEIVGNYSDSLEAYLTSLRIYQELGDEFNAATTTGNIGILYYYLGDHDKAFEYHTQGLEVFQRLNRPYFIALALGNLSPIYRERGDYAAAAEALQQVFTIFHQLGEKRYEATTHIQLGTLYELQDDPKAALEHLHMAAKIAEEIENMETYSGAYHQIGELYRKRGKHRQAIAALRKGLTAAMDGTMAKPTADLHHSLARAYEAIGKFPEALDHQKRYAELQEQLYGEERQRAIAEMQVRFDVERAEREREMFRLKSEHLEEMMEQRSKELTSMAMHLVQKNAFLQKLRKDTVQLATEHPKSKGVLDTLLRAIAENLHGDEDWQRFEQEFQLVHHDFMRMLSQQYPRLTPAELKVCTLLKINLSNKEIANLLSVSLRNVESHRYSIRKKLGLPSDANLTAHLVSL